MPSFIRLWFICLILFLGNRAYSSETGQGWSYSALADVQLNSFDTNTQTWFEGGSGKLNFNDGNHLAINQLAARLEYQFNLKSEVKVDAFYQTLYDNEAALTQAFWQFKPLISNSWRARYRVGMFYAPISLENTGQSWLSNNTDSFSVINSWLAEELRTIGIEGIWTWQKHRSAANKFSLIASVFGFNDPAGSKLAWQGWASHSQQTGLGNNLALRDLPIFEAGQAFDEQASNIKPFVELDNRPGFYLGTEWRHKRLFKLQWLYYNNRGDPLTLVDNQYAWHTKFHHLALKLVGANSWALSGQFITGRTVMGALEVDNDFQAAYLLLTKALSEQQNLAVRLETFSVDENDSVGSTLDPNEEDGEVLTVNFSHNSSWKNLRLYSEARYLRSTREARLLFDEAETLNEFSITVGARYQF